MISQQLENDILTCVADISKVPKSELSLETKLYDSNIISSLGILDLIAYLEQNYKIIIMPEELTHDNFGSINTIINFVHRRLEKP